jgi:hypothetical protein
MAGTHARLIGDDLPDTTAGYDPKSLPARHAAIEVDGSGLLKRLLIVGKDSRGHLTKTT